MNLNKVREDFPILKNNIIYMDSACMSLKPIQVIEAMNQYYYEFPACAGRSSHRLGRKATEAYNLSRETIAKFFNAKTKEIIFTRNTTEGINLISNSLKINKILTTDKEHNSNHLPWLKLNIDYQQVKSKEDNTFDLEDFQNKIKGTKLVSMVHTSNLDGTTIPIKEIIKIAHENNALVLIDGAQSSPHKEINLKKLDVDFFACSGHKMLGPTGTGMLYIKEDLEKELKPFMVGGETVIDSTYTSAQFENAPEKFEAGLQNYAGMIGFAEATRYLKKIGLNEIEEHEKKLNTIITKEIENKVSIIGPKDPKLRSGIISFTCKKDPHEIALTLDTFSNIMIRSGAHCVHPWFNAHNLKGSARASIYLYNTEEECKIFVESLNKILKL